MHTWVRGVRLSHKWGKYKSLPSLYCWTPAYRDCTGPESVGGGMLTFAGPHGERP